MMRNFFITITCLIFNTMFLYPQTIRTTDSVSELMAKKFASMRGFSANFLEKNNDKIYRGRIFYKNPNKFKLVYNQSSDSHQIVSNGETLWIYLPRIRVVSEQKISDSSSSALYTKEGVNRLLTQYNFNFYDERELVGLDTFDDDDLGVDGYTSSSYISGDERLAYHMLLTPKQASVEKTGFIRIHLWIDTDGMIIRMLGVSTTKIPVEYLFWNINYHDVYSDGAFELEVPQGVQVLKNDLVPR